MEATIPYPEGIQVERTTTGINNRGMLSERRKGGTGVRLKPRREGEDKGLRKGVRVRGCGAKQQVEGRKRE